MAKKTTSNKGRAGDGLDYLGLRDGRKWWQARIYWIDPRTGKHREKQITFQADSKPLAVTHRADELERAKGALRVKRERFAQAAEEWFATLTAMGTRNSWGCHKRKLVAHFDGWWADAITRVALQDYLDALPGKPGYVNSRLDVARNILDFAIRKGWVTTNVAKEVKRRSTRAKGAMLQTAPRRALSGDEAARYLADLQEHEPEFYPLALTQLVLGCRFAEASGLHHEDVDLETGIVTIRRDQVFGQEGPTKGQYARTAALPLAARALLKAHRARMADEQWPDWQELVFPRPPYKGRRCSNHWSISTAYHMIRRSFARTGIADVTGATHVARHTMISLTGEHAADALMRKMVGHTTPQMHARYKHAFDAQVIDFADAVVAREIRIETGTLTGTRGQTGDKKPRKTP